MAKICNGNQATVHPGKEMFLIWSWGFPSKKGFPNCQDAEAGFGMFLTQVRKMKFAVFLSIFWMCGQVKEDFDRCASPAK